MSQAHLKPMLETRGLQKAYVTSAGVIDVLKGVDLEIGRGEVVAIAGPSGAGKSTLLHLLGGLDEPSAGVVTMDGINLAGLGEDKLCGLRGAKVGFVFQFYHLLPEFTALENVFMPALVLGRRNGRRNYFKEAKRLLELVGLGARLGHLPSELSGGECQRVAIARALINKPAILLCDEPTGNLDTRTGDEIFALLKGVSYREKTTLVMVTHNLKLAEQADCLYCLEDGLLRG